MTSSGTGAKLSGRQRERLANLADWLIAGGAGLPSASEADVHGTWIDRALAARPDLQPVVLEVIGLKGEPGEALDGLQERNRSKFDTFAFAISGAYLINPRVRQLLGFPGPIPAENPAFPDEADSYLDDGLLDVVILRGPIYRPTPLG